MNSRFVNLVVRHMNGLRTPFRIHRIDPAKLFYPTGSPVPREDLVEATKMEDVPLPHPHISFSWPCPKGQHSSMDFMAFGRNRDKIVAMDNIGRTYLYVPAPPSLASLPTMPKHIMKPITVAVGDNSLFVMSRYDPQFVALMHDSSPSYWDLSKSDWYWQSVQPPTFPSRSYGDMDEDTQHPFEIGAYTVVGNSQILLSDVGAGTFSFDTESCAWNKAGEWLLPFRGGAEYVPEHNLWFGFSDKNELLSIADLSAVSALRPPVPQILSQDMVWPKDWILRSTELLPLGSGKLCIARLFLTDEDKFDEKSGYSIDTTNNFMVLVGVEVVAVEGGLRMILHKSQRYNFGLDLPDLL